LKYRVVLPPHVEQELEESYRFIAEHSPDRAVDWYNDCLAAISSLAEFPSRCPILPGRTPQARQLIHGNYRIIFVIEEQSVRVIHVVHGARQGP
jgi:toxin ParE1/3/4